MWIKDIHVIWCRGQDLIAITASVDHYIYKGKSKKIFIRGNMYSIWSLAVFKILISRKNESIYLSIIIHIKLHNLEESHLNRSTSSKAASISLFRSDWSYLFKAYFLPILCSLRAFEGRPCWFDSKNSGSDMHPPPLELDFSIRPRLWPSSSWPFFTPPAPLAWKKIARENLKIYIHTSNYFPFL